MKTNFPYVPAMQFAVVLVAVTALSACGGGSLSNAPGQSSTPAAKVDESMFARVSSYCTTDTLKPGDPAHQDGWVASPVAHGMPDQYTISAIASANGHAFTLNQPITMHVSHSDYRGVKSTLIPSGYGKPEWVMGVSLPTLLAPHAAACVTQVARINYPTDPFANTPFAALGKPVDTTPVLYWRSFWDKAVPVAQLSGYPVDGFEFVSDFQPSDGQVYFVLDKARFTSPQTMSICFLAAGTKAWDCRQPTLADQGANWQLFQRGLQQGVYVLTSPTLP